MIKHITWLALALILSLSTPVLAAEPPTGTIEGRIVNGTEGGVSVANQKITLRTYQNGDEISPATVQTDTEGHFVFKNIATSSSYSYQISLTFQEAEYAGEILDFSDNESTKSVELTVYDSTMSDEAISVVNAHTVIYVGQGSLKVEEFFLIANMSDRNYIGSGEVTANGKRKTLSFPLPTLVSDFQYSGDLMTSYILPDENGFIDTMPVLPGSKQIVYSYQVNYNSSTYTLSRTVYHPTLKYNLLVQGESVVVDSDQLTKEGIMNLGGALFTNLSGSNLEPGDIIIAQLSGLPTASKSPILLWVGLALVLLSGGAGAAYLMRRKTPQPSLVDNRLVQRQQRLLSDIAQLDDDFESGMINEEFYRRLRTEKKAELAQLMRRAKEAKTRQ